jgi:hypothetical protein
VSQPDPLKDPGPLAADTAVRVVFCRYGPLVNPQPNSFDVVDVWESQEDEADPPLLGPDDHVKLADGKWWKVLERYVEYETTYVPEEPPSTASYLRQRSTSVNLEAWRTYTYTLVVRPL